MAACGHGLVVAGALAGGGGRTGWWLETVAVGLGGYGTVSWRGGVAAASAARARTGWGKGYGQIRL